MFTGMEQTCVFDWMIFAYVLIGVILLAVSACAILYWRSYPPLRMRNPPLLAAMCFTGIVHIISAAVADEHFVWLSRLERANCVMWNFWLPYFIGLLPWYCCMYLRIMVYASAFSMKLTELGSMRVLKYRWAVIPSIALPVLLLFSWTTLVGGSYLSPELGRCQSDLVYKVLLLVWIVFCASLLLALSYFARRTMRQDYENEFEMLWRIAILGSVVLAANAVGILLGLQKYCLGRTAITGNVVTLHLFSVFSLVGDRMYKAILKDKAYDRVHAESQEMYAVSLEGAHELVGMPHVAHDFLEYCENMPRISCENMGIMEPESDGLVDPKCLVLGYKAMQEWQSKFGSMTREEIKQRHLHIVRTYLLSDSSEPVCANLDLVTAAMNTDRKSRDTFSPIASWIYSQLNQNFGVYYVRSEAPERRPWSHQFDQQQLLQCAEKKKAHHRLQNAGLLGTDEEAVDHSDNDEEEIEIGQEDLVA